MNKQLAATLLDPETKANIMSALEVSGRSPEEIMRMIDEAERMGAEALRFMDTLEDDLK